MFQGGFKGVSRKIEGCLKGVLKGISRVFERISMGFMGVLGLFKEVQLMVQGSLFGFQGCLKGISRKFQGCFKED